MSLPTLCTACTGGYFTGAESKEPAAHWWHVLSQNRFAHEQLLLMVEEGGLQEGALPKGELCWDGL